MSGAEGTAGEGKGVANILCRDIVDVRTLTFFVDWFEKERVKMNSPIVQNRAAQVQLIRRVVDGEVHMERVQRQGEDKGMHQ